MIEFEIEGKKRGFRFGTYTFRIINELLGRDVPIEEVFKRLEDSDVPLVEKFDYTVKFCLACAKHYAMTKKQEIDFTEFDVSEWIDELGMTTVQKHMAELVKVYSGSLTKNHQALEETGPPPSSNGQLSPSLS